MSVQILNKVYTDLYFIDASWFEINTCAYPSYFTFCKVLITTMLYMPKYLYVLSKIIIFCFVYFTFDQLNFLLRYV